MADPLATAAPPTAAATQPATPAPPTPCAGPVLLASIACARQPPDCGDAPPAWRGSPADMFLWRRRIWLQQRAEDRTRGKISR